MGVIPKTGGDTLGTWREDVGVRGDTLGDNNTWGVSGECGAGGWWVGRERHGDVGGCNNMGGLIPKVGGRPPPKPTSHVSCVVFPPPNQAPCRPHRGPSAAPRSSSPSASWSKVAPKPLPAPPPNPIGVGDREVPAPSRPHPPPNPILG